MEYTKPDLSRPLALPDVTVENIKAQSKAQPLKGFAQFQKARKTNEEMYAELSNNANITINTWMNLVGASVMAAGGLVSGVAVFIVASMLVSPIMGPILGMVIICFVKVINTTIILLNILFRSWDIELPIGHCLRIVSSMKFAWQLWFFWSV